MTQGPPTLSLPPPGQQAVADSAAAVSVTMAGWTWVTQANEILQLVATVVAIVAGLMAARFHYKKTQALRTYDDSRKDQ